MSEVTTSSEETIAPAKVLSGVVVRLKGRRIRYVPPNQVPKVVPLPAVRRPAKVARLLALAHQIRNAIDRGVVADRATAARQLGFTRARLAQLLDLALLAPKIQEAILELEAIDGVEPTYERRLRRVVRVANWGKQKAAWRELASLWGGGHTVGDFISWLGTALNDGSIARRVLGLPSADLLDQRECSLQS